MCGIAGWLDFNKDITNYDKVINEMSLSLGNRGPDDSGTYIQHEIALIHRRLIVIDPLNGVQPMKKNGKGDLYTIIYNGELYNTAELQKELLCLGYNFTGHSDTEVLLTAFIEWGENCLEKLNGIFAFAVWKEKEKSLFIARDRLGVKPLYYYKYEDGIIFASEIKALLKNPLVRPVIDDEGLKQIFLLGPGKICGSGIIKGIKELKPAEFIQFNKNYFNIKQYWKLSAKEHTQNLDQTIEQTRFLVTDSIKRQLVSDVPLACFLSGGLDSSIISMIASNSYREKGKFLTTYSVDYKDNSAFFEKNKFQPDSDNKYITLMADFIKSNHVNIVLDNIEVAKALYEASLARDLPGMADIDSSLLLFCREVKKNNTVCVSGECADEIFGGYPWYHDEKILFNDTFPWSQSVEMRKKLVQNGVLKDGCDEFVREQYLQTVQDTDYLPSENKLSRRMREMFMLNFKWFMQTLLDRKDRMSMYCGLEVRVPFCDHRLVEYAYNMPWEFKSLKGREKGIVREAFKDLLPKEIVWRAKSPYPKTFNPIYLNFVKEKLNEIMQDKNSLLPKLINKCYLKELLAMSPNVADPWYGQLMRLPQIFAYLIQTDYIFKEYKIEIE